jgi:O-antigen/teichoic acid export membrane protein
MYNKISINFLYNLLGYTLPLVFALFLIPILLSSLGTDRFGLLNLAWIVIGYFGFFDLGIGRALTKIVAEKIGINSTSEIPSLFWTSIFLMFAFSSIVAVLLLIFSEDIIFSVLRIPFNLQEEALHALYLLIISIPIVSTTAGMRGLFEAYQRFDVVNIIRVVLGVLSFLFPVIVTLFTNNLFWIITPLVIIRIIIWIIYLIQCFRLNQEIKKNIILDMKLVKPIFKLSSWMTISNITVPIIVYLDRILIASLISATAVAYYATPYEIVTKLLIVPTALTAVLFPTFSANYLIDNKAAVKLSEKAMKYIALLLFPVVAIITTFSFELIQLWLGKDFASNSYIILQFLSIGILFNSIAYIPFSFIEGIGRPDITAKLQLVELPLYVLIMWLSIKNYGIYGAAFIFMLRMIFDCMLMIYFSRIIVGNRTKFQPNRNFAFIIFVSGLFVLLMLIDSLILKTILSAVLLFSFLFLSWKYFLDIEDRNFIISKLKPIIHKAV